MAGELIKVHAAGGRLPKKQKRIFAHQRRRNAEQTAADL